MTEFSMKLEAKIGTNEYVNQIYQTRYLYACSLVPYIFSI